MVKFKINQEVQVQVAAGHPDKSREIQSCPRPHSKLLRDKRIRRIVNIRILHRVAAAAAAVACSDNTIEQAASFIRRSDKSDAVLSYLLVFIVYQRLQRTHLRQKTRVDYDSDVIIIIITTVCDTRTSACKPYTTRGMQAAHKGSPTRAPGRRGRAVPRHQPTADNKHRAVISLIHSLLLLLTVWNADEGTWSKFIGSGRAHSCYHYSSFMKSRQY